MSARPWMPLYIADYLADTAHLRAAESGAYLHLIMHYWQHSGLPESDRSLATIAKMTDEEWRQCRDTLAAMFQPGWRHKRVDKELAAAEEKYQRRARAGRKGAEATNTRHQSGNAVGNADPNQAAVGRHKSVVVSSPAFSQQTGSEDSGIARAREAPVTSDAQALADEFCHAIGVDPRNPELDGMSGVPYQAAVWLERGYGRSLILATASDIAARDGPRKGLAYYSKAIESAHLEQAARPQPHSNGHRHGRSGNPLDALDQMLAGAGRGSGPPNLLRLSKG